MTEKTVIYNNPLDGRMERYSGMAVTPDMVMEYLEYDIVKADEIIEKIDEAMDALKSRNVKAELCEVKK